MSAIRDSLLKVLAVNRKLTDGRIAGVRPSGKINVVSQLDSVHNDRTSRNDVENLSPKCNGKRVNAKAATSLSAAPSRP